MDKDKMSKSLGNFITIRDVLKDYDAEVLRFFLLSSHYRSPLIYTTEALLQSRNALTRFYTALRFLPPAKKPDDTKYEKDFIAAMDDDFNTPIAISILFDLAHEIQRMREQDVNKAASLAALLKYLASIIGLLERDTELFFKASDSVDADKVEQLILQRQKAREEKNWAEADKVRNELAAMNVVIEDGAEGTTWKVMK